MRLFGCYDSQYFIAIVQTSERPKRPSRTLLNNAISTQERSLQNAATSASSFLPSTVRQLSAEDCLMCLEVKLCCSNSAFQCSANIAANLTWLNLRQICVELKNLAKFEQNSEGALGRDDT